MKLESLKLTNFRGFREFEISFDPSFTVLLGPNMAGKSAVLDAAAAGLAPVFHGSSDPSAPRRFIEKSEIHRTVVEIASVPDLQLRFPVRVDISVSFRGTLLSWGQVLDGAENIENFAINAQLDAATRMLFQQPPADKLLDMPVIAQYGIQRTWGGESEHITDLRSVGSRRDGYDSCFNIRSTYGRLAGWMRKQTLVQLQRGGGYFHPQLAAVENAVKCCISDVTRFWFDLQYEELRLERSDGDIQSFSMLSEGYRNIVATVADIAWRTSVLNPQHGPAAHQRTEGVVLIDELDLHLHPSWQRRIVADLRRTFPKIQFIVTTHSPQIVASVTRDQIRLLDRNQLIASKPYVEGRDSNEILEDVFGVPKRPEPVQAEIDALYRLIEDEDFVAARTRLAMLEEHLGPEDAAMIRARWILDTEDPPARSEPSPSP